MAATARRAAVREQRIAAVVRDGLFQRVARAVDKERSDLNARPATSRRDSR